MTLAHSKRMALNVVILVVAIGLIAYIIERALAFRNGTQPPKPPSSANALSESVEKEQLLSSAQVKAFLDRQQKQIVILDIQERSRFKEAHMPAAINIPSDELVARAEDELSKSDLIIIVSSSCDPTNHESLIQRSNLIQLGFVNTVILDGGLNAWKNSFPIVTETSE